MISRVSVFKLLDRGFKDIIVLIPGWATDYKIFANLDLGYNYLLPINFSIPDFRRELLTFLNKKSIGRVSLFGWSLGGFLAQDFAKEFPDRVDELILLSIRKQFERRTLKEVEAGLRENKRAYLYKFYLECFSKDDREELVWFKKYLLMNYLKVMKLEDLIYGLHYLSKGQICPESLASLKKIRIFHGLEDKIAPFKEIVDIKSCLPQAKFICMPQTGHIPFLNRDFKDKFYYGGSPAILQGLPRHASRSTACPAPPRRDCAW